MPTWANSMLLVAMGGVVTAAIIGFFVYLKDTPKRAEVKLMIESAIVPLIKSIDDDSKQSRENFSAITDVKIRLEKVNSDINGININLQHMTSMVLEQKTDFKNLLENSLERRVNRRKDAKDT
jgi:hypothetical protein